VSGGACCQRRARPGLAARGVRALPWLVPSVLLVLLPKCPMCLAAWVAVLTGAGVSAATASSLRVALAAACALSLGYALLRFVRARLRDAAVARQ
jgi:hypothetical protein